MYHHKTEKWTRSAKSVKTPTLPELFDDNKRSQPLPQVQAFNRLTPDRSMPTPRNKHLWHQRPHSSDATTIHLMTTDYVREISSGTSSATDMKITTHRKPTWELPSLSETTLKILQRSDASKPMSMLELLRSKKEALDTVDLRQVPIPEADRSVLASDVVARSPRPGG
jgi:carbohydrate-binding DOMON domain-containing protein